MRKRNNVAGAIGILALAFALENSTGVRLSAQDAEANVQAGDAKGRVNVDLPERSERGDQINADREADRTLQAETRTAPHVGKLNKATGLIGMNVVNRQNEKLGSIKDMVMDLESGKVSYAVLSVGGFLGIGDKLIAVPPSALSISATQDSLVLNADQARLESLPGLVQNEWPNFDNPQFSANWELDPDAAVGGSNQGQVRSGRGQGREDNAGIRAQARIGDNDADVQTRTELRGGPVFSGRIASIDPEKRLMRVEGESGTRQFTFTEKPTLNLGPDNRNPKLIDFKVGYNVNVGYHEEGDDYVAHSVIRTDPPSTR